VTRSLPRRRGHRGGGVGQGELDGVSLMARGDGEVRSGAVGVVLTDGGVLRLSTVESGDPCGKVRRRGR
jgi:hypothetical protein